MTQRTYGHNTGPYIMLTVNQTYDSDINKLNLN